MSDKTQIALTPTSLPLWERGFPLNRNSLKSRYESLERGKASLREAREKGKGEREKIYKSFPFNLSPGAKLLSPFPFNLSPFPRSEAPFPIRLSIAGMKGNWYKTLD